MNSTALGAENTKKESIIFISEAHEKFYYEKLEEVRYQDVYHKGCRRRYRKAYATKGKGKRRNLIRKSEIFLFLFPTLFPTCYNYFGWE